MSESIENGGILGTFLKNPEMLSGILSLAGNLSKSMSLFSPPSEESFAEEEPIEAVSDEERVPQDKVSDGMMNKHKKLVEALMGYVGEDKRPKLELVLKILDIVSLAEGLRGT